VISSTYPEGGRAVELFESGNSAYPSKGTWVKNWGEGDMNGVWAVGRAKQKTNWEKKKKPEKLSWTLGRIAGRDGGGTPALLVRMG